MAAGLAGGIGLSGGACGALGAAIWLIEMARVTEGGGNVEFNSPEATEAIDRFVQSTDCEFECAKIAGRKFVDVQRPCRLSVRRRLRKDHRGASWLHSFWRG